MDLLACFPFFFYFFLKMRPIFLRSFSFILVLSLVVLILFSGGFLLDFKHSPNEKHPRDLGKSSSNAMFRNQNVDFGRMERDVVVHHPHKVKLERAKEHLNLTATSLKMDRVDLENRTREPIPGQKTTREMYESGFEYGNPSLCPNNGLHIRLLILIMSCPTCHSKRNSIRWTWGHYTRLRGVSIGFILGRTENVSVQERVDEEMKLYDDLIITNSIDSYDNLTLKTIGILEWINTFCNQSEFILKTDDDMFIHVPNVLSFLTEIQSEDGKSPSIYGHLASNWTPFRDKESKYYVSLDQYPHPLYPNFTSGPCYLFSTKLSSKLYRRGLDLWYFKLEDVYLTGLVAQSLGIPRVDNVNIPNERMTTGYMDYCQLDKTISIHDLTLQEQFEIWTRIMVGREIGDPCHKNINTTNNNNNLKSTSISNIP